MTNKPKLIIIAGPTAVGKTDISVKVAKKIGGEIISADSMQVYRDMNIGTAKVTSREMMGIKHYMIDVLDPSENFNVSVFKELSDQAIYDVLCKNKVPIMVGGTGFYIQAVLYGIDFSEGETDEVYSESLYKLVEEQGEDAEDRLYEELRKIDPESSDVIHKNNIKRVIRALEYYHCTGKPISEKNKEEKNKEEIFHAYFFVITDDRQTLYDRIDKRVDKMMADGLMDEVKYLYERGISPDSTAMHGIGYSQLIPVIRGEDTLEHAVWLIKRDSRRYAKRQLTWFKREKNVVWINRQDFNNNDEIAEYISKKYREE
jgi:tRNA dimethylallyltransferase